jgi:hypothetical protein
MAIRARSSVPALKLKPNETDLPVPGLLDARHGAIDLVGIALEYRVEHRHIRSV